jgi:hypothetical protein
MDVGSSILSFPTILTTAHLRKQSTKKGRNMRNITIGTLILGFITLGACSTDEDVKEDTAVEDTAADTADSGADTGTDTGDTADTSDTADTAETGDTADTAVDPVDTGDTGTSSDTGSDTATE